MAAIFVLHIDACQGKPGRMQKIIIAFLAISLAFLSAAAMAQSWGRYTDPLYGTTVLYPAQIFSPVAAQDVPGQSFLSSDGQARLAIGVWENPSNVPPAVYRDQLLSKPNHPNITYRPRGRSWFVLSGYRGDRIYYEKVMYSCGWRLVNVFAMVYPIAQRTLYDPIVERMEDTFRPGARCR